MSATNRITMTASRDFMTGTSELSENSIEKQILRENLIVQSFKVSWIYLPSSWILFQLFCFYFRSKYYLS